MYSSAHYLLQGLTDLGIEYVFSNLGTDHASVIEELARWREQGRRHPRFMLCPHENVAIHMAAGYAAMTGQGQAVMVHVDAGTANAAMGMHNMFRSRLPVMLMAGRAPGTVRGELPGSRDNYVHFVQDPFDMASLVRPYVKWEYSLSTGINAREVVRRGHSVMQSDPPGPVYLTLPREALTQEWAEEQVQAFGQDRYGPVAAGGIDAARAEQIAEALMGAERPMAVTAYLGRKAEAVEALEELALLCGIRVFEFAPSYLGISRDSPCFGGFDPGAAQADADLGLLLDVDVRLSVLLLAAWVAARWLARPMDRLAAAARELGRDIDRPPLPEDSTRECREASRVFNQMQARIRRQLQDRDRFVAAVSHDLRTPLTRLRLRAEALPDGAERERFARDIAEMDAMIGATLDHLRGVAAGEPLAPLDVQALVQSLADDEADCGHAVRVAGHAGPLPAQAGALRRCIANLVGNAVRYGGGAEVTLADDGACVRIAVRDHGPGLPEAELDRVFEPFYRAEASRNRAHGGVGLGLSIARDIAERHGGSLRLRNAEGGGLCATLALPRTGFLPQ